MRLWPTIIVVPFSALALTLTGCTAGTVGLVAGMFALDDSSSSGGVTDAPPTVQFIEEPQFLAAENGCPSPFRIAAKFVITNEDEGELSAHVEVVKVDEDGNAIPSTREPATLLSRSEVLDGIASGQAVAFHWDVGQYLQRGTSSSVRLVVTPIEDGVAGTEEESLPFRAGNTPIEIRDLTMTSNQEILTFNFTLIDEERHEVQRNIQIIDGRCVQIIGDEWKRHNNGTFFPGLVQVELRLSDQGEFHALPLSLIDREVFLSAPAAIGGDRETFSFDVRELLRRPGVPEQLLVLGEPGFYGRIAARVSVRSFEEEPESVAVFEGFLFDTNDPPVVQVLPFPEFAASSAVIPIRYRVFDAQLDPADVTVEVNLGDGFEPAAEFPTGRSQSTNGVPSVSPDTQGDSGQPVRTFLWDALSQLRPTGAVVRVRASDPEEGPGGATAIGGLVRPSLRAVTEISVGASSEAFVSGDFDGDGFLDVLAAGNDFSDTISYLRGGAEGISAAVEITAGRDPTAFATGDFDGDGFLDALVANSLSDTVTYLRGGEEGIDANSEFPVGDSPEAIISGDFNGDGLLDALVANNGTSDSPGNTVSYLRGSADGFETAVEVPVGESPGALVSGNFNGDEFLDALVITGLLSGNISYLRGNAEGVELAAEIFVGGFTRALVSGDFDDDGFADALVGTGVSGGRIRYLRGSRAGIERGGVIEVGSSLLVSGDFDGDGFLDALAADAASDAVHYLRGTEAGIEHAQEIVVGSEPAAIASGDFDGDGFFDAVVANRNADTVSYLRGFAAGIRIDSEINVVNAPAAIASGDFDGDGFLDAVVASGASSTIGYLRRSVGIKVTSDVSTGDFPSALVVADFDDDGFLDALVANTISDSVSYLRGSPAGFDDNAEISVGESPIALVSGDFDGDGYIDALVANEGTPLNPGNTVSYLRRSAEGILRGVTEIEVGDRPKAMVSGDFDGDGLADALVLNVDSDSVSYLRGSAAGIEHAGDISVGAFPTLRDSPTALVSGDFNGDGRPDALITNELGGTASYLRNSADGFEHVAEIRVGDNPTALVSADFNGDGFTDALVAHGGPPNNPGNLVTYLCGSLKGIETGAKIEVGSRPRALASGDFDGDGFIDALVANGDSNTVSYLRGGDAGLENAGEIDVGMAPIALASGDFDGDGFMDALVADWGIFGSAGTVSYLRGSAAGIQHAVEISVGVNPRALASGDFDGDGFTDGLVANGGTSFDPGSTVTYLRGRYLQPHTNRLVVPAVKGSKEPELVTDPRTPPRYRLTLPPNAFNAPTQVCLIPGPYFELPQVDAAQRGKYLLNVSSRVALLRETNTIDTAAGPAELTLRLRPMDPAFRAQVLAAPERLRVFRKTESGMGELQSAATKALQIINFGEVPGKGFQFPIERFGNYIVAIELDREGGGLGQRHSDSRSAKRTPSAKMRKQ